MSISDVRGSILVIKQKNLRLADENREIIAVLMEYFKDIRRNLRK